MKYALLVSFLIHMGIAIPFVNMLPVNDPAKNEKPILVDYVKLKEPQLKIVPAEQKTAETPKIDIAKKVETKPAEQSPAPKNEAKALKDTTLNDAKEQAQIKSTRDYINYYQLIREKIRKRLKSNYRNYYKEGDVTLVFTLASDGRFISAAVNKAASIDDLTLQSIALASIREASPFPSFPKALFAPQMSFDLTVTFKRR